MLLQHSEATYAAVHQHIASHLKMAPHRQGGAGKGCHIPSRLLNPDRAAPAGSPTEDSDDGLRSDSNGAVVDDDNDNLAIDDDDDHDDDDSDNDAAAAAGDEDEDDDVEM